MAAPTVTTLLDDFNRADGLVGAGAGASIWGTSVQLSSASGLSVAGNAMGAPGSSGVNGVLLASYGPAVDYVFDISAPMLNSGNYFAAWWALAATGTASYSGMAVIVIRGAATDGFEIRRYTSGGTAASYPSGSAANLAAGDRVWINSDGTNHNVYVARAAAPNTWALVTSATDATYNRAGVFGYESGETNLRIDNLLGGTVTAGGTTQVSGTRRIAYNVSANVAATRRVNYGVLANVAGARRLNYGVRGNVAGTRRLNYSVTGQVASTRRISYVVLAGVVSSRRLAYTVQANVVAPRRLVYNVGDVVVVATIVQVVGIRYGVSTPNVPSVGRG